MAITVCITGASGLVGSEVAAALKRRGDQVRALSTRKGLEGAGYWDPLHDQIDIATLDGCDAVVHLAGENIAKGRWTAAKKERIASSRILGTRLLCRTLGQLSTRPRVLVAASAIGYYGSRGAEVLDEQSPPGTGFLADVCQRWEAETAMAAEHGVRVVNLRIGVVLSPRGGALASMLPPFRMGLGGRIGTGQQYLSWVALEDVAGVILEAIDQVELQGPVNCVAPGCVTNGEFTRCLGQVLHRPTLFPMPAAMARLVFGEMADELLLSSTRVQPAKLEARQFPFRHPQLGPALAAMLGKQTSASTTQQ